MGLQGKMERSQFTVSVRDYADGIAQRLKFLIETDSQIAATLPDPAINTAKRAQGLGFARIVATCMEGYADRPALAERATELKVDPATGRATREIQKHFESTSYGTLWNRARSLAAFWHHDASQKLVADEFICVLAFVSVDFGSEDVAVNLQWCVAVLAGTSGDPNILRLLPPFTLKEAEVDLLSAALKQLG